MSADFNSARFLQTIEALPQMIRGAVKEQVTDPEFSGSLHLEGESPETLATLLLPLAACFSVAPISGFQVGAVAVGAIGTFYPGANLEFPGATLGATLHAEQSAVTNAWMHGERSLQSMAVSESPCGFCRQFLRELPHADALPLWVGASRTSLAQLLPMPFGAEKAPGHSLLDSPPFRLRLVNYIRNDALMDRVIAVAAASYAPYARAPEGCRLQTADQRWHEGRSAESIAFNPSLPAAVSAMNQRNLSSSRSSPIIACWEARARSALPRQEALTRSVLENFTDTEIQSVLFDLI